MKGNKDLEFLAEKSKRMVEKQIDSYRQKHSNAGIIIGSVILFFTFFLNGLSNACSFIQYIAIVPSIILIASIILMLDVLRAKLTFQFFSIDKFDDLVDEEYEEILLYEIGANNSSFRYNKPIDQSVNGKYNRGVILTIIAVVMSLGLLLTSNFIYPENEPTEVYLIKHEMTMENSEKSKEREIPKVPESDLEQLQEGVGNKDRKIKQKKRKDRGKR